MAPRMKLKNFSIEIYGDHNACSEIVRQVVNFYMGSIYCGHKIESEHIYTYKMVFTEKLPFHMTNSQHNFSGVNGSEVP